MGSLILRLETVEVIEFFLKKSFPTDTSLGKFFRGACLTSAVSPLTDLLLDIILHPSYKCYDHRGLKHMNVCKCKTDWIEEKSLGGVELAPSSISHTLLLQNHTEHAGYRTASCTQISLYYRWIDHPRLIIWPIICVSILL